MRILLKILRFQPELEGEARGPRFERFEVDADPGSRLLDALIDVQRRIDPTLALRKSCGHGVCGSDAMIINGREGLACKTLVREAAREEGAEVVLEPLKTLATVRDLVVDETPFFRIYRSVTPYLIEGEEPADGRERRQRPAERQTIDDATNCILCAACYSACPVVRTIHAAFIGPAAIVQAFRFQEDSRDHGFRERLAVLDHPDGVWPCENKFECTRVCPRGIKVTKLINLTKNHLKSSLSGPKMKT